MSTHERRGNTRHAEESPVSAVIVGPLELSGEAVNKSEGGILFTAGHLRLLVSIDDQHYRGRLVRAIPFTDERTQYGVALEELVAP